MASLLLRGASLALTLFVLGSGALAARQPNIVFILTDDLDTTSATKMEQVKAQITDLGTSFRHHYVNVSLCCPSRVAKLRGQFAHNSGIYGNDPPNGGFEGTYARGLESSTVASWLQDAGYRTALFGKYLNGYPNSAPSNTYIPPGWTEWYSPNGGTPYSEFDYKLNENGTTVEYGNAEGDYLTDVIAAKVIDFIRRSVEQHPGQPFFAYVAPFAPHQPATPAPRHSQAFPGIKAPRTASFNEADISDKPPWLRKAPLLTEDQIAVIDEKYGNRRRSLLAVDEMVKSIVDTLTASAVLTNTFVVYTSDNGFHQGEHRLTSGKQTAFEEDVRIPLSVRGPGVPVGVTVDAFTANVDYAPTFAELAGIAAPSWVDGRSILPYLRGQTPPSWRQAMMLSGGDHTVGSPGGSSDRLMDGLIEPRDDVETPVTTMPPFVGLRTTDGYTYVSYTDGEQELYQTIQDPKQLRNRWATTGTGLKKRLTTWLASLNGASGEALRQAELAPPSDAGPAAQRGHATKP